MANRTAEEVIKPSLSPQKAIELFKRQISQIDHLKTLQYDDPEVDKWGNVTSQIIIQTFGKPHENLGAFYSARRGGPMWMNMPDEEIQENYLKARENFRKLLEGFVEQLELFNSEAVPPIETVKTKTLSKKIFIVHGHDSNAKSELARFLTRLDFEPIILHEQANSGQTLIEKLERHSDVGFAFILLTPDDVGKAKAADVLKDRARQNVVFEFGLFVGKLGRKNVCCLHTGNIELPSDLQGLAYVPYVNSVNEVQLDLIKELRAVGYEIKV